MLDEYFKKIENFITPTHYSRDNYKDKIILKQTDKDNQQTIKDAHNVNKELQMQNQIDSINNLLNTNTKEEIIKLKKETQGKLELPEENKINLTESLDQRKRYVYRHKEYNENDVKMLFEKLHKISFQCMNYRYENEKLKNKLNEEERLKNEMKVEMEKIAKKNQNLQKHLLKLEEYITSLGKNTTQSIINTSHKTKENESKLISSSNSKVSLNNQTNKNSNSELNSLLHYNSITNIKIDITPSQALLITETNNTNHKTTSLNNLHDIKSFILKLFKDNYKLRNFQAQVYELSTTYDDINENLLESIKNIQAIMDSTTKKGKDNKDNLLKNYKQLVENVEKTLNTKQKEYNILLSTKDEEINMLQEELLNLNNEIQVRKKDRLKEQQMISELQREVDDFKIKRNNNINENNDCINYKRNNNNYDNTIDNRIEPVKKAVNKIVKNIEKNFNMKDKHNVNMIGNIQKTVQN